MTARLSQDFWNDPHSQELRREIIRNDSYMTRQRDAPEEAGGRYSKIAPTTVTGQSPISYPQISSGPWSAGDPGAPNAATDTLGYSVQDQEPCGSVQEIDRSLERLTQIPATESVSPGADLRSPESAASSALVHDTAVADSTNPNRRTASSAPSEIVRQGGSRRSSPLLASSQPNPRKWRRRF
jgi:hypothetical protein